MKRLLLLIIVLSMSACGGEDEISLQSGGADQDSTPTTEITNLTIDAISGTLVYTEGDDLHLWTVGQEPVPVGSDVVPTAIFVSPNQEQVVYFVNGPRRTSPTELRVVDMQTGDNWQLVQLGGLSQGVADVSWSPNREWLLVQTSARRYVVKADGSQSEMIGRTDSYNPFWLVDNTVLMANIDRNSQELLQLQHYDPSTATMTDIDITDLPALDDMAAMLAALEEMDYQLAVIPDLEAPAPLFQIVPPPDYQFNEVRRCDIWQVQRTEDAEVIYEGVDVAFMTEPLVLNDGSMLLTEWRYPDCNYDGLQARLLHLRPDEAPTVITDTLFPGDSMDARFAAWSGINRYALSSDQRYLVWLGGTIEQTGGSLNLTDLQTNETIQLLHAPVFTNLIWIDPNA